MSSTTCKGAATPFILDGKSPCPAVRSPGAQVVEEAERRQQSLLQDASRPGLTTLGIIPVDRAQAVAASASEDAGGAVDETSLDVDVVSNWSMVPVGRGDHSDVESDVDSIISAVSEAVLAGSAAQLYESPEV
jgi:hypothetical protein